MDGWLNGRIDLAAIRTSSRRQRGFTLIELLVVIAVIAILAALLFPVFGHVREQVHQTNCMTDLHEIGQDVALYREDNGKYPPILLDNPYYTNPSSNPPPGQSQLPYTGTQAVLNAQSVLGRPFASAAGQKYNADVGIFQCPDNVKNTSRTAVITGAVFPPGATPADLGSSYDSQYPDTNPNAWYYSFDSYDTGPQINASGVATGAMEIHYALDWTGAPLSTSDAQNQLKYPLPPPDKTVITWCTYHVAVAHTDQILVLLLNGTAKSTQYTKFVYKSAAQPQGPLYFTP